MSLVSVFIIPRGLRRSLWVCSSHQPPLVFVLPAAVACLCVVFFFVCTRCLLSLTDDERKDTVSLQSWPLICLPPLLLNQSLQRHTKRCHGFLLLLSLSLFFLYISQAHWHFLLQFHSLSCPLPSTFSYFLLHSSSHPSCFWICHFILIAIL